MILAVLILAKYPVKCSPVLFYLLVYFMIRSGMCFWKEYHGAMKCPCHHITSGVNDMHLTLLEKVDFAGFSTIKLSLFLFPTLFHRSESLRLAHLWAGDWGRRETKSYFLRQTCIHITWNSLARKLRLFFPHVFICLIIYNSIIIK